MADEIQIRGTNATGKIRNPLGVIGLSFITFGIYYLFWYYKVNQELAEIGRANNTKELGDAPGTSLLAVTLGAFLLVPPYVSIYHTWQRLNAAERLTGQQGMEAGLGLVLTIFIAPVAWYLLQSDLNKVLQAQAAGAAPQVGAGAGAPAVGQQAAPAEQVPVTPPASES